MSKNDHLSRRTTLKGMGLAGASAFMGSSLTPVHSAMANTSDDFFKANSIRQEIFNKVRNTPLIDTHEHLIDEKDRLANKMGTVDDWSMLLSMYVCNDMTVTGMPGDDHKKFFHSKMAPRDKWKLIEPYWKSIKNTGYGLAVRYTLKELYGVGDLSEQTVDTVQSRYEAVRKPGFYKTILTDMGKIESCQVNDLEEPVFRETSQPTFLLQDISLVRMFGGPDIEGLSRLAGMKVQSLSDWHKVIDYWFKKYGPFAVAVKSQDAYGRDIDYKKTPAEQVEQIFNKKLNGDPINPEEQKALSDHLFWYAVDKARSYKLPIKLHTGYYAGENGMPLSRLMNNPGSACDLCRQSLETPFVFMHICYPYYEEMIALAKHYSNAYIDMCWSWIINPIAAKDFVKKFIVTAPANKLLTFGGDYVPVEPVLGHALMARKGISLALCELVEEGWITLTDAFELTDTIMHNNAKRLFNLKEKQQVLKNPPWKT